MDKIKHICHSPFKPSKVEEWRCEEGENGMFLMDCYNDNICFTEVKYCPYCGYKTKLGNDGQTS